MFNLSGAPRGRGSGPPGRGGRQPLLQKPGGAPRALMDLALGMSSNETWFDAPQPAAKQKVDDEVEMYYHEELMEKLVNIKGVSNLSHYENYQPPACN